MYLSLESEDVFHHDGFFIDTKMNEEKMKEFLNQYKSEFVLIADKFIEKISKREDSNNR